MRLAKIHYDSSAHDFQSLDWADKQRNCLRALSGFDDRIDMSGLATNDDELAEIRRIHRQNRPTGRRKAKK